MEGKPVNSEAPLHGATGFTRIRNVAINSYGITKRADRVSLSHDELLNAACALLAPCARPAIAFRLGLSHIQRVRYNREACATGFNTPDWRLSPFLESNRGHMLSLPPALFLVLLGLTVGLVCQPLRPGRARRYQPRLRRLSGRALPHLCRADAARHERLCHARTSCESRGLDESWLGAQGPLVVAFSLLMIPWNALLWLDRQPRRRTVKRSKLETSRLAQRRYRAAAGAVRHRRRSPR